jgi:hypothetical protein
MASTPHWQVPHPLAEERDDKRHDGPAMFFDGRSSFRSSLNDFYFESLKVIHDAPPLSTAGSPERELLG